MKPSILFWNLTIATTGALSLYGCRLPAGQDPGKTSASESSLNSMDAASASIFERFLFADYYFEPKMSPFTKEATTPDNFKLSATSFPKSEIGKYQRPGTAETGTPEPLRGIWWMDGNPLGDETISFADLDFSQDKPLFSTFAPNNFSYHSGKAPGPGETQGDHFYEEGAKLFAEGTDKAVVYEFNFEGGKNSDYKYAIIKPVVTFKLLGFDIRVRIQPGLLKFTLEYVDQDTYHRNNYLLGRQSNDPKKAGYILKRILKPSPTDPKTMVPTKYWEEYVNAPGPAMLRFSEKK
jgi:hypothetical protein